MEFEKFVGKDTLMSSVNDIELTSKRIPIKVGDVRP